MVGHLVAALLSCGGAFFEVRGEDSPRELPFPSEAQSTDALSRSVAALHQKDGKLMALPEGKGFVMVSPFDPKGASREKVFAPLVNMERFAFGKEDTPVPDWRGLDQVPDRQLFFDGRDLAWIESDPKTMSEILRRSIPWDMIRPPRDSRGEPTSVETKALRSKLKKIWSQTLGLKVSGIARIPESWVKSGKKTAYILASRLKDFPLMLMECDAKEPSLCQVSRQCYLEGASQLDPAAVSGVAVSTKNKMIFIGDSKNHMIHGFKFSSCYHVPRVTRKVLPRQLKTINNLFIDSDDRLWVSTSSPDDYLNASIYFWPQGVW
jgi:hypothetical protein